ncbi:MAG: acyltransferase family protein [Pseudobacter sp.]|uniref:acyltransferase family protein n=1 Tax=Pseudobacter sp. TaxID=2045420 RepID=UPI003F7EEA45
MQATGRNLWVDYLRSAITVLVVAHHASLAYTTFASFDPVAYIRSTNPVVDHQRWIGMDVFSNFNDIFFMFLMFFIGGLFIAKSLEKKGSWLFIKDRIYRLLIPFIVLGTLFMLLAYYPSYYLAHQSWNIEDYVKDFFTTEAWPVGPPWFLWVLFVFNAITAIMWPVLRGPFAAISGRVSSLQNKPVICFFLLFGITWILYVPVAWSTGAGTWTGWGPFDFQLSRFLAYAGYFLLGVIIGAGDFNSGIFSVSSKLVRHYRYWIVLALLLFASLTFNSYFNILAGLVKQNLLPANAAWGLYYSIYAASCTASCLAFITVFRKTINSPDRLWDSLSTNAYLIYLVHYIFIVWMQFLLMPLNIHAFFKFIIVFVVALGSGWIISIRLRTINLIHRYC